jgi:hypothetical protein
LRGKEDSVAIDVKLLEPTLVALGFERMKSGNWRLVLEQDLPWQITANQLRVYVGYYDDIKITEARVVTFGTQMIERYCKSNEDCIDTVVKLIEERGVKQ